MAVTWRIEVSDDNGVTWRLWGMGHRSELAAKAAYATAQSGAIRGHAAVQFVAVVDGVTWTEWSAAAGLPAMGQTFESPVLAERAFAAWQSGEAPLVWKERNR
jgi:hypothetical protein